MNHEEYKSAAPGPHADHLEFDPEAMDHKAVAPTDHIVNYDEAMKIVPDGHHKSLAQTYPSAGSHSYIIPHHTRGDAWNFKQYAHSNETAWK